MSSSPHSAEYQTLFEQSRDAIYIINRDGRFLDVNDAMLRLFGYGRDEILELNARELYSDPAARSLFQQEIERNSSVIEYEVTLRTQDGTEICCLETSTVRRDGSGGIIGYQGIIRDITHRRRLEEQLRQAQKMEALGHLAGGVAHDFNNLLTGITGYAQLVLGDLPHDSAASKDVRNVIEFANRAARLTRQLLAFSRQQPLEQNVVNFNAVVADASRMIERIMGENVETTIVPAVDLGNVRADIGEIQQVLMNLVINARDAMQDGGRLTIATRNVALAEKCCDKLRDVTVGDYAMVAISDTGCGMDEPTKRRIFDPFFTTKEIGKGTGLGLAAVYGIVKQHAGEICVRSEPGEGSTFEIYLPIVDEEANEKSHEDSPAIIRCGRETVLLVEDDEAVRAVAERALQTKGYRVLVASRPSAAQRLFSENPGEIDLLVTDVVMPEMDGLALYALLSQNGDPLKVLYMSGYTGAAAACNKVMESGALFLPKPFTPEQLAQKVREVFDR